MPFHRTVTRQTIIGEQGITLITRRCLEMGFLFQPRRLDHGIDGHIELVAPGSGAFLNPTLLVQSKAKNLPFPRETEGEFHYKCDECDLRLWLGGNVPVILILSHPEQGEAWWVDVRSAFQDESGRMVRSTIVDKSTQRFDRRAIPALLQLAAPRAPIPVLSHALRETWLRSGGRDLLTLADYQEAGGISGAVAATAEAMYAALEPDAQDAARRILLRLVDMRSDTHATRLEVRRGEFMDTMSAAGGRALTALTTARLVILDGDTVEIVHEALAREWPRLRDWLEDNRAWLRTRDQLVADADEWDWGGREKSRLYRGTRLAVVRERLEATLVNDIDHVARAFLDVSIAMEAADLFLERARQARECRTARWLRWLAAGLAVLLLVAAVTAGFAFYQRGLVLDERALGLSRQQAGTAESQRDTNPNAAHQLAVLAWRTAPTVEAR